jgi:ABC-type uncharacterized transport system involved in gliding motility auxiliary subunit
MPTMVKPYLKLSRYYLVWCLVGLIIYSVLTQFPYVVDLTYNKQRTLSDTTISLLQKISSPITFTLYSNDSDKLIEIQSLVQLYQQQHAIDFKRARPIGAEKLTVEIETKHQEISLSSQNLNEDILTKAIFELYRKENQWVAFLQGHGEPQPFGDAKTDLGWFAQALKNQGLKVQGLPLYETQVIPDNTQLLVIANPKTQLLPKEIELIRKYIQAGHNLLWLSGPDEHVSLSPLLAELGLQKLAGTVVDEHGYKMGTPHPAITVIDKYSQHVSTQALKDITAFPWAAAFRPLPLAFNTWQAVPILTTHDNTWTEKGNLMAPVQFNPEQAEISGPLQIGFALHQAKKEGGEQKIVVIGTSKFLTNSAIANYGNLSLGIMLTNWLSADAGLLNIPYPVVKDLTLQLTPWTGWMIEYGLRWVLPLLILLSLFMNQFKRYAKSMHYSRVIKAG